MPGERKDHSISPSLRASSPIWASETSLARTRERAAKPIFKVQFEGKTSSFIALQISVKQESCHKYLQSTCKILHSVFENVHVFFHTGFVCVLLT